jgi:polyphosphate kinase
VIRREGGALRQYVHLSTGNYNAKTARLYTDLDLLTCEPRIGEDVSQLLNVITGYSSTAAQEVFAHESSRWAWRSLVVSPVDYHAWVLRMIERETRNARDGKPAHVVAKLNALVEPQVIDALGRAADAGVKIDLIVRGICCLVPRENIRVISIIDRFLEHTRIFLFRNAGNTEVYVTSGDWMPRNFFRRIEVTWPILAPQLRDRIELQILGTCLADDAKSWRLQPDGTYRRRKPGTRPIRSQQRFIEIARAEAVKIEPGVPRRKVKKKR